MNAILLAAALVFWLAHSGPAYSATLFTERASFENELGNVVKDDYQNPGYWIPPFNALPDALMSSVVGETKYKTTGFVDSNMIEIGLVPSDFEYCAGCNGSFLMDFASTSVSSINGVFGVGFDYYNPNGAFHAFVTFGDDTTADYALPGGLTRYSFFGITSDLGIRTIHMGLEGGAATQQFSFTQDNLTLGSEKVSSAAPEPDTLALLGISLAGLGFARHRKMH